MNCPFKVGDRIHTKNLCEPTAIVTKITEKGFEYEYDETWCAHPRLGIYIDRGECYENGFAYWWLEDDADWKKGYDVQYIQYPQG